MAVDRVQVQNLSAYVGHPITNYKIDVQAFVTKVLTCRQTYPATYTLNLRLFIKASHVSKLGVFTTVVL